MAELIPGVYFECMMYLSQKRSFISQIDGMGIYQRST
jgi:hypothetical protein